MFVIIYNNTALYLWMNMKLFHMETYFTMLEV